MARLQAVCGGRGTWIPNTISDWKGADSGRFQQRLDLEQQAKETMAAEPSMSLGWDVSHLLAQCPTGTQGHISEPPFP